MWPGFGENSRALKWMCERVDGKAGAKKTPIGYLPNDNDLDLRGLNVSHENIKELLRVDAARLETGNSQDGEILFAIRRPTAKEITQSVR